MHATLGSLLAASAWVEQLRSAGAGRFIDLLPLWLLFVLTSALLFAASELGCRLGARARRAGQGEQPSQVGAIMGAALALFGFLLAFTFGIAASRFEDRRQLVLQEANAIGTTYLRAGLVPEPQRSEIRGLLREYVQLRIDASSFRGLGTAIERSDRVQQELWARAAALGTAPSVPITTGLFVQSLNETIDLHAVRLAALRNRIPGPIWAMLFFVAFLGLVMLGYHAGVSGARSRPVTLALILSFAAVMVLIADLDRPGQGLFRVSQQAMLDLQEQIARAAP
jgi:hypothetical protein